MLLRQVIIEVDSIIALQFAEKGCPSSHLASELVLRIQDAARSFDRLIWNHTLREGNSLADYFAKRVCKMLGSFRSFGSVPDFATIPFLLIALDL
ncbi:Ribonuclease H superfamily [Sesbania bispinosa]|nr:Ribonuclease H superfamily [Sesbania bispinosa]